MTTPFDREISGFRFADIHYGDTLQAIALRELGDAARWPELISYNNLVPPFLASEPGDVRPGVLSPGDQMLLPAPAPASDVTVDPMEVFGRDIRLSSTGELLDDGNGDFAVIAGGPNLQQALRTAIGTDRGDLMFHPSYGSKLRRLIGTVNRPTAALMGAQYAAAVARNDPRVSRVDSSVATSEGDVIRVQVSATAVNGRQITTSAER